MSNNEFREPSPLSTGDDPTLQWLVCVEPRLPEWLWTIPVKTLLAVLDVDGARFGELPSMQDYYWVQLREMALRLIVEAPVGPPASTMDFLSRFDPHRLATMWGGDAGVRWAGEPGVDRMIAALLSGRPPVLTCVHAELTNRFRQWSDYPEQLREAVLTAEPDWSLPPQESVDPHFSNSEKGN